MLAGWSRCSNRLANLADIWYLLTYYSSRLLCRVVKVVNDRIKAEKDAEEVLRNARERLNLQLAKMHQRISCQFNGTPSDVGMAVYLDLVKSNGVVVSETPFRDPSDCSSLPEVTQRLKADVHKLLAHTAVLDGKPEAIAERFRVWFLDDPKVDILGDAQAEVTGDSGASKAYADFAAVDDHHGRHIIGVVEIKGFDCNIRKATGQAVCYAHRHFRARMAPADHMLGLILAGCRTASGVSLYATPLVMRWNGVVINQLTIFPTHAVDVHILMTDDELETFWNIQKAFSAFTASFIQHFNAECDCSEIHAMDDWIEGHEMADH